MDSQTELTDATIAEMQALVSLYSARNAFVPESSNNNGVWDRIRAQRDRARELFEALPAAQQAEVVRVENVIAAHHALEEQKDRTRDIMGARAERLRQSECRLRDADHRLVCRNELIETAAIAAARDWYRDRPEACSILTGGCGSGKSIAGADLIASHAGDALFLDADTAVKVFNASFGEQYNVQQEARNTGLLVLDDVGAEADASKMLAVLLTLHNARKSARHHPWLLTTNLNKRDFAARYSNERLMSRMYQSVWTSVSDHDFRRGMK